jgi:hypothetical protein
MNKTKIKLLIESAAILLISFFVVHLFSVFIPYNMDDYAQYINISTWTYHLSSYNTFREDPRAYDLAVIDHHFLPLRSFVYVGSIPGFIYYPLYKLWPSPDSARFLGLLYLAVQAFLIYKIFDMDLLFSFAFLFIFMPYGFQHIVDPGVVSLLNTSVFAVYYFTQKWFALTFDLRSKKYIIYPVLAGLMMFLAFWSRLSYLFYLPSIILMTFSVFFLNRDKFLPSRAIEGDKLVYSFPWPQIREIKNRILLGFAAMFAVLGVLTYLLLHALSVPGYRYYEIVFGGGRVNMLDPKALAAQASKFVRYFLNPPTVASKVFDFQGQIVTPTGIIYVVTFVLLMGYGIFLCYRSKRSAGFIITNIFLFLVACGIIMRSQLAEGPHHIIPAFPFLILALFYIMSQFKKDKVIIALMVVFICVNASFYWQLVGKKDSWETQSSLIKINNLINQKFEKTHVVVAIDWGMYYLQALYGGKDQCVLYIQPFNDQRTADALKKILKETHRKPLFLVKAHSDSNVVLINSNFPGLKIYDMKFDSGEWRIWYQP